mgnify:CR=1 FL=1|jgi:hypothetical protein
MNEEEKILRESIRHAIRIVKKKRLDEENKFRKIIQSFIDYELKMLNEAGQVPDDQPTPNKSTGINVLEDLLKKIIPQLEIDYRMMTTADEQRDSFRAHIVNAVINTLTPAEINTAAGDEEAGEERLAAKRDTDTDLSEDIEVEIEDDDADKFIDIGMDRGKKSEEDEEEEELTPQEEFGADLEDADETGRNMAYNSFKKIESSTIDSYELLSNEEDQELFYDYLIANLKLYFDKFEDELSPEVEEPTNQAYDTAKADAPAGGTEELDVPAGLQEVIELEL